MIEWPSEAAVIRIQERMVSEFGGMAGGVKDIGILRSALDRPKNVLYYSPNGPDKPNIASLAANYAYGIAKNHAFVDANKRTALETMELFLGLNGMRLRAKDDDVVTTMVAMASSEISLEQFEGWVKKHICLDKPHAEPKLPDHKRSRISSLSPQRAFV